MNVKNGPSIAYLVEEIEGDTLTPISIFHRVKGNRKFLLESSYKHEDTGRYSFIGYDPFMEVKNHVETCDIYYFSSQKHESVQANILEVIKDYIKQCDTTLPFPFFGGAVGYIGYDVVRQYEEIGQLPKDDLQMPDAHLLFYGKVIIMDHLLQKVYIVLLNLSGNKTEEQMQGELTKIKRNLTIPSETEFNADSAQTGKFHSYTTKEHFIENIENAKKHIRQGDIFQVVLSQRLQATFTGSPFTFYRQLRRHNPSPYMFYIDFEEYIVLGSSPESFIKVHGNEVTTNPIAGTRKRAASKWEDQLIAQELLEDEKELAEHRMLVDLARNDLGRVCQFGTIELSKYMTIERFKHVMHITSEVKGKLKEDISSLEVLAACLPAGTVSGAPKVRAMQIINELEPIKRGVYGGAVGYININGDLDFGLAIRTMVIKGKQAYVQAGAGIVLDSDPEKEYEETLNKAAALLEVNG